MKLLYFSWVRERIGLAEETKRPPPEVTTVGALMAWLAEQGEGYAAAFADPALLKVAINQKIVPPTTPIADEDEVAFFPPFTGG
ncbi:MAG: molybdopterin converting factor subunit 1 [Pseudomonadota bacterium]